VKPSDLFIWRLHSNSSGLYCSDPLTMKLVTRAVCGSRVVHWQPKINVSEGHVYTDCAHHLSVQYQTPLPPPSKPATLFSTVTLYRYVSVPGTLLGFLEISVASVRGEFYYYQLCCMHASHVSDLKTTIVKVRAHL
jgi:hypothetical protein